MPSPLKKNKLFLSKYPFYYYVIFIIIIFLMVIGLNYFEGRNRKKKILSPEKSVPVVITKKITAFNIINDRLASLLITPVSMRQFQDSDDNLHVLIKLKEDEYYKIESGLEKVFFEKNIQIDSKDEYILDGRKYFLWKVLEKNNQKISFLFSFILFFDSSAIPNVKKEKRNIIVIIIDDIGYNLKAVRNLSRIPYPLNAAIIPFSPFSKEAAEILRKSGKEIILHLPLESVNSNENNQMKGIILSEMSEKEIMKLMDENFSNFPYIQGVNNHMGSKITKDRSIMKIILEYIKQKNVYFIDSKTTRDSIAFIMARNLNVPTARRHVFLDGKLEKKYIRKQLRILFEMAQEEKYAIGICHASEIMLTVLKNDLPKLTQKYQVNLVFASEVVH